MKITPIYRQILLHIAWWVFYIGYFLVGIYARTPDTTLYFFDMCLHFLSGILFFYFYVEITVKWFFEKKNILLGVIFFLFNACILYGLEASRLIWASYAGVLDKMPSFYFQPHTLMLAYLRDVMQFTGFGTVYWFYHHSIQQQKEKLELEQHNHQIEISFLKSQIQEHFTYNMLSLFHSEALKHSDKLANGLQMLSALMRYSVSEQENTMVALDEEIKYIQSLVTLSKMRLDKTTEVHFEITGNTQAWRVPHLGLLTLVENALKHGAIKQGLYDLQLSAGPEELVFSTKNMKREKAEEISTGIGLKNLERRLQLLTQGKSALQTHEDEQYFYTNLKISI